MFAFCASGAIAAVTFEPKPSNFEDALLMLSGASMKSTVGPVLVEGDGVLRYTTGLYPPETIELDLPELRSASPLDALRWSNRWREIIEGVFGGEREMVSYWEQGATIQGEAMFSVLRVGKRFLSSENGRTSSLFVDIGESNVGVGRAVEFALGGGASGGGGGGGGGGSSFNPFAAASDGSSNGGGGSPIVNPVDLPPPSTGGNAQPLPPSEGAPIDATPEEPRRFGLNFSNVEWVNPTFNRNPAPPRPENSDGNPFDNDGGGSSSAPLAIPTPTAVGLGAAGLLALGASSRRRRSL